MSGIVGQRFAMVSRDVLPKLIELPPMALRVYLALAIHADAEGNCFPSRKALALMAHTSEEVTRKMLRELSAAGLVIATAGHGRIGSTYFLPLHPVRGVQKGGVGTDPSEGSVRTPVTHQTNIPTNKPSTEDDFEAFWNAYPKKVGKAAALRAWKKTAKQRPSLPMLLASLEKARSSPQWGKDGGQYIPHPATWLNGGHWDDETALTPPPSASPNLGVRPYAEQPGYLEAVRLARR